MAFVAGSDFKLLPESSSGFLDEGDCGMQYDEEKQVLQSIYSKWPSLSVGSQHAMGTVITKGSVSGPYLFNIFLNDPEIKLGNETLGFKYAGDCTIIAPVYHDIDHSTDLINQFVRWAGQNRMNSNPTKCKELIMYKRGYTAEVYSSILGIPQTREVTILGLTFQPNCKSALTLKKSYVKLTNAYMSSDACEKKAVAK